jgi:hypothetical protein
MEFKSRCLNLRFWQDLKGFEKPDFREIFSTDHSK